MKRQTLYYGVVVLFVAAFVVLAGPSILASVNPTPQPTPGQSELANPASTYCVERGYRSEIRTAKNGSQSGVCVFPDVSECDEWAFFRGECGVKWRTPTK